MAIQSVSPKNPFVGLRSFKDSESLLFFGRSKETGELLDILHETHFLTIIGSSGCGKSSLIRSGLIPCIQGGFLVEKRDRWLINTIKPGGAPISSLGISLHKQFIEAGRKNFSSGKIFEYLTSQNLERLLTQLQPFLKDDSNLLILVDQFEELFRFQTPQPKNTPTNEARIFVNWLIELASQRELPVFVIITMRSDFIGDCDAFPGLPEMINQSQFLVPRMNKFQRQQAIEGPIHLFGKKIAPDLIERLLAETGHVRDDLPVLQHLLMRIWNNFRQDDSETIGIQHYEAVGGMEYALARHANEALKGMSDSEIQITKRMFQALTDTDSSNRQIRRPAAIGELLNQTGAEPETLQKIIQKYQSDGRTFLLASGKLSDDETIIDISHESLIRQWPKFQQWVKEENENKIQFLKISEAANDFKTGKIALWDDPQLQLALNWKTHKQPNLNWANRYSNNFNESIQFLEKSRQNRDAKIKARRIRNRISISVLTFFLVLTTILAIFARKKSGETTAQLARNYWAFARISKEKNETIRSSHYFALAGQLEENKMVSLNCKFDLTNDLKHLSLNQIIYPKNDANRELTFSQNDKYFITWGAGKTANLYRTENPEKTIFPISASDSITQAVFDAKSENILLISSDKKIHVWSLATKEFIDYHFQHSEVIDGTYLSNNAQHLLTWTDAGNTYLWNVEDGKLKHTFTHGGPVKQAIFNSDETLVATCSTDKTVKIWRMSDGKPATAPIKHSDRIFGISFIRNDSQIMSWGSPKMVSIWNIEDTSRPVHKLQHFEYVNGAIYQTERDLILTWSADGTARMWSAKTGQPIGKIMQHSKEILGAKFSNDSKIIVTWSKDGMVKFWDAHDGSPILSPLIHNAPIDHVVFSDSNQFVSSWDKTGILKIWNLNSEYLKRNVLQLPSGLVGMVFNSDSSLFLTVDDSNSIQVWNRQRNSRNLSPMRHDGMITGLEFSQSSNFIVSWGTDQTVRIWRFAQPEPLVYNLTFNDKIIKAKLFEEDSLLITCTQKSGVLSCKLGDNVVKKTIIDSTQIINVFLNANSNKMILDDGFHDLELHETKTGRLIADLPRKGGTINGVIFSQDENRILYWNFNGEINLWNIEDSSFAIPPVHLPSGILGALLNKDESKILSWGLDSTVRLWETKTGKLFVPPMKHSRAVLGARFSPDEKYILSWANNYTAHLWNALTGKIEAKTMEHNNIVTGGIFNKHGNLILTWSQDGTARLWNANDGTLAMPPMQHKDWLLGAAFTPDERHVISWGQDNTIRWWDIRVDYDFPNEHLPLLTEVTTGTTMDEFGNATALSKKEWETRKRKYIKIAENHLKTCQYKNANLYQWQKIVWSDSTRKN